MADIKYNYNWVLDAKSQRDADPIDPTPKGIASKPDAEESSDNKGFYERMYDRLVASFGDEDEAVNAMSGKKPSREAAQSSVLEEIEELARRSSEEAALFRMEEGITQSLPTPGFEMRIGEAGTLPMPDEVTVRELDDEGNPIPADTAYGVQSSSGKDSGQGLMSPATETEEASTTNVFATVTKAGKSVTVDETTSLTSGFSSLTEAEGTDIHLDGRGYVTLPYGIVPDKNSVKKADGTAFDPTGSHGITSSGLSGVDYSGATKFGISRTDYDTDQAFAKAVYAEFGSRTATQYGDGFDDLTEEAKQAAYDMAWNAGIGAASWSSVKTMLKEASKEGEKSKDSLIGFTTNFKSGTDYPRGLLKRRLQTYNLVANAGEEASTITTTASMTDGARTGTIYTVKAADGTVLKTWSKPDTNEVLGDLEVAQ